MRRRKRRVRAGKVALRFLGRCPAAGAPALECAAAEAGLVVAELRRAPGPGLGGINCVLNGRNDLITIRTLLLWNAADLWRCNWPRLGLKLSIRAPGNIR